MLEKTEVGAAGEGVEAKEGVIVAVGTGVLGAVGVVVGVPAGECSAQPRTSASTNARIRGTMGVMVRGVYHGG